MLYPPSDVAACSIALVIGAPVLLVTGTAWLLAGLARRLQAGPTAFARLTELPCGLPDGASARGSPASSSSSASC
jgi:hypothetical protein